MKISHPALSHYRIRMQVLYSVGLAALWLSHGMATISLAEQATAQQTVPESKTHAKPGFRTFFVTRSLAHDRLLPYLKEAKPEIVQIGNYGAMFHGYADDPRSTKSPMMLPVAGERAALTFQKKLNQQVHSLGLKVVGHFRLIKVMADWKEQTGFVEYYNKRWPEDLLGPRPHADLRELLQRDADGQPVQVSRYDKGQLTLCLSSPYARQMLKQMLKCAVDHGVDGVMTNYNYRFDCACPHCQKSFKQWLAGRMTAETLRKRLGVEDLENHHFKSIPARIPGYPDPATAQEIDWLAMRWGAEHFKQMFDDIFIDYGRSLKKDLLVAQWNHLSHVSLKEERMFVPMEMWGRGEDYFWNSGGASFVRRNLDLKNRKAGDAWLSCLYTRELSGNKPFVMGKYDGIRLAVSMAEGYATGGLGMGRYMRFEDPVGYEVLSRYTRFMHRHRRLYEGTTRQADAALILPRQTVLARRPTALDAFRELGQALLEQQVLLDVVADQKMTKERLARYPAVILPQVEALSDGQIRLLREYSGNGGMLLSYGDVGTLTETGRPGKTAVARLKVAAHFDDDATAAATAISTQLQKTGAANIESPWTVRVAAYSQPNRTILHLVNYNRNEAPDKSKRGPELERPIAVENVAVDMRLPTDSLVSSVVVRSPDENKIVPLEFEQQGNRVSFKIPRLLVYGVVTIDHESG